MDASLVESASQPTNLQISKLPNCTNFLTTNGAPFYFSNLFLLLILFHFVLLLLTHPLLLFLVLFPFPNLCIQTSLIFFQLFLVSTIRYQFIRIVFKCMKNFELVTAHINPILQYQNSVPFILVLRIPVEVKKYTIQINVTKAYKPLTEKKQRIIG